MRNNWLVIAGLLSLGLTSIHIFGGGSDVHAPIITSALDPLLKAYVSVVWHGVTAMLIINSLMLSFAAFNAHYRRILTGFVLVQYLAFAGLFLAYSMSQFGSLIAMPPWIGFLIISAIAAIGLSTDIRRAA